jgi:ATP-binding cassette subfamily B protein/subfamily B ATP-binding cassette protein MsbA
MKTLFQLLSLLRGYRLQMAAGVGFALAYTVLALVPPLLIRSIVQRVAAARAGAADPDVARSIALIALAVAGVAVLRGACRYGDAIVSHIVAYKILDRLLRRVYAHLQRLPHRFFVDQRTGALATRAVSDVEAIEVFIAHAIAQAVQAALIPSAMIVVLFTINPRLALVTVAPLPFAIGIAVGFAPRFQRSWRRVRHQLAELGAAFHEDVGGLPVIKSFTREPERREAIAVQSARFRDEIIWANKLTLTPGAMIEAVGGIGAALVIWQGGLGALTGDISTADLLVFVLYVGYIYQPILQLSALSDQINNAIAAGERVFELLATKPEIVDSPHAIAPSQFDASVTFDRVVFGYDPARPVLRGLELEIRPGETVALVGTTGAGKTTTVSLIPRFYDVQAGAVRIGGQDVRDVPLDWLRCQVGMVAQDVFLFHGTVRDNLLFGRPNATDAELRAAARAAHAEEFIVDLPYGYETLIGERGIRLSGGQKQRLSIARAILKDAPILILDEPTSSVDVETEALIQDALARLSAGRTTIVIAHRLSTVRSADRIAVLDNGQVAECGDHATLEALNGLYARLHRVQVRALADLAARSPARAAASYATFRADRPRASE